MVVDGDFKASELLDSSLVLIGNVLFEKKGFETGVSEKEKNVRHRRFEGADGCMLAKSE